MSFQTPRMDHASNIKDRSTQANNIQSRMSDLHRKLEKFKSYRRWELQWAKFFEDNPGHPQEKDFSEKRMKPWELEQYVTEVTNEIAFLHPMIIKLANNLSKDTAVAIELAKGEMTDPEYRLATPPKGTTGLSEEATKASPHEAQEIADRNAEKTGLLDLTRPSLS